MVLNEIASHLYAYLCFVKGKNYLAMEPPKVAIVILNWNGTYFLKKFLPSVVSTQYPNAEIYVADNASTDDSIAFVRNHFPEVKIILNNENLGFAGGYNKALSQIEAKYFVLLNQDVEVTPGWIDPVIDLMEKEENIAACQPKLRAFHHKAFFEYAGAAGGWIDRYGYPFCRGRVFKTVEKDKGQYDNPQPIFWASGAALFIKSSLYRESGGLDTDFFAHMEEIDLCWRLQRMGYKVMVCPQSIVYHVGGGSLPQGNPRKVYLNFRNNLIMLYKNLMPEERDSILFNRKLLDGIAALKSLCSGNFKEVKSIWKAHQSFRKWKKEHKNKLPDLSFSPYFKLSGVYKGSIIWDYYVKKEKIFPLSLKNKK